MEEGPYLVSAAAQPDAGGAGARGGGGDQGRSSLRAWSALRVCSTAMGSVRRWLCRRHTPRSHEHTTTLTQRHRHRQAQTQPGASHGDPHNRGGHILPSPAAWCTHPPTQHLQCRREDGRLWHVAVAGPGATNRLHVHVRTAAQDPVHHVVPALREKQVRDTVSPCAGDSETKGASVGRHLSMPCLVCCSTRGLLDGTRVHLPQ
jgi:hypothetical protein